MAKAKKIDINVHSFLVKKYGNSKVRYNDIKLNTFQLIKLISQYSNLQKEPIDLSVKTIIKLIYFTVGVLVGSVVVLFILNIL